MSILVPSSSISACSLFLARRIARSLRVSSRCDVASAPTTDASCCDEASRNSSSIGPSASAGCERVPSSRLSGEKIFSLTRKVSASSEASAGVLGSHQSLPSSSSTRNGCMSSCVLNCRLKSLACSRAAGSFTKVLKSSLINGYFSQIPRLKLSICLSHCRSWSLRLSQLSSSNVTS